MAALHEEGEPPKAGDRVTCLRLAKLNEPVQLLTRSSDHVWIVSPTGELKRVPTSKDPTALVSGDSADGHKPLQTLPTSDVIQNQSICCVVAFLTQGSKRDVLLVATNAGVLYMLSHPDTKVLAMARHGDAPLRVARGNSAGHFITVGAGGEIRSWIASDNAIDESPGQKRIFVDSSDPITCLVCNKASLLFVGLASGTVRVFDVDEGLMESEFAVQNQGSVSSIALSSSFLHVAWNSGVMQGFRVSPGELVPQGDVQNCCQGSVLSLVSVRTGRALCSLGADNTLRYWRVTDTGSVHLIASMATSAYVLSDVCDASPHRSVVWGGSQKGLEKNAIYWRDSVVEISVMNLTKASDKNSVHEPASEIKRLENELASKTFQLGRVCSKLYSKESDTQKKWQTKYRSLQSKSESRASKLSRELSCSRRQVQALQKELEQARATCRKLNGSPSTFPQPDTQPGGQTLSSKSRLEQPVSESETAVDVGLSQELDPSSSSVPDTEFVPQIRCKLTSRYDALIEQKVASQPKSVQPEFSERERLQESEVFAVHPKMSAIRFGDNQNSFKGSRRSPKNSGAHFAEREGHSGLNRTLAGTAISSPFGTGQAKGTHSALASRADALAEMGILFRSLRSTMSLTEMDSECTPQGKYQLLLTSLKQVFAQAQQMTENLFSSDERKYMGI